MVDHRIPVGSSARPRNSRSTRCHLARLTAVLVVLVVVVSAFAVITLSSGTPDGSNPAASTVSTSAQHSTVPASKPSVERITPSSSALGSVISTIDLVDNRTLPGTTLPAIQSGPSNIVYDSANGDLYVRGGSTAVTVVSATTDRIVTTLGVEYGGNPYSLAPTMAVDTLTGNVYTTNYNAGNISIINGTTNLVSGTLGTGLSPISAVFDPDNGYLYVSDWTLGKVTVFNGANNQILYNIPVGGEPSALLYDHASSEVFVANFNSNNVSIIDTGTHAVVKNIPTGTTSTHPQVLALDTKDNYVDVGSETTYNISVIDATTGVLVAHPYVPYDSDGLAYSPTQDELFVENGGEGNVSVFNQSEDTRIVANITTGTAPEGIALDPINHEVYVLNSEVPNVTVINPANNHRIANIWPTDGLDYAVAVDTTSGNVFVGSSGTYSGSIRGYQSNVTVIAGSTNLPVASIPLDVFPEGLTYDPANQDIVAADVGGQDLYLVNGTTGLTERTVPTGYAWTSAYDTATGDLWVLNEGSENITVLNSALQTVTSLTPGLYPQSIAYDSANGDMYVSDEVSGDVWVFDGATHTFLQTILVKASAQLESVLYDPHNQEVYVADWTGHNLSIINGSSQRTVGWVPTGLETQSLAFDSANDTIWASNSGNYTVISDRTNTSVANVTYTYAWGLLTYNAANNVMYDASSFESIVAGIGASNYSALGYLYLGETYYTSGITYDPANHDIYASTADGCMISVIGPAVSYPVQFDESGLPHGKQWNITLSGSLESALAPASIGFTELPGSHPYTVGAVAGYTANVTSGTVTVTTEAKTVYIGFTALLSAFPVTFIESGLASMTPWSVTFHGAPNSSSLNSIGFLDANGTWPFTVATVSGYTANVTSGNVTVHGVPETVLIGFTANASLYPVNFTESGLSSQTPWSVTLTDTLKSSSASTIGFAEPNGSYSFTVGTVVGYSASPNSGSAHVTGGPFNQVINFTAGTVALSVKLTANPSSISLGNSTILTATTSGGTPPFAYAYTDLPTGCTSQNTSSFTCKPTVTGSFTVNVTVTDTHGGLARSSASLNVTSAGSGAGTSSGPSLTTTELLLIILVIVAAVLLILFVVWRRRHAPPPPAAEAAPPPTPPPS